MKKIILAIVMSLMCVIMCACGGNTEFTQISCENHQLRYSDIGDTMDEVIAAEPETMQKQLDSTNSKGLLSAGKAYLMYKNITLDGCNCDLTYEINDDKLVGGLIKLKTSDAKKMYKKLVKYYEKKLDAKAIKTPMGGFISTSDMMYVFLFDDDSVTVDIYDLKYYYTEIAK